MPAIPNNHRWLRHQSTDSEAAKALNVATAWLNNIHSIEKTWSEEKKADGFDKDRPDDVRERVTSFFQSKREIGTATIQAIKDAGPFFITNTKDFEVEVAAGVPQTNDLDAAISMLRLTFKNSSASITTAEELQIFLDGLRKDEAFIEDIRRHGVFDPNPDAWLQRLLFGRNLATHIHHLLRKCNTAEADAKCTGVMAHNADWSGVIKELYQDSHSFGNNMTMVGCSLNEWMRNKPAYMYINDHPGPKLSELQCSLPGLLSEIRLDKSAATARRLIRCLKSEAEKSELEPRLYEIDVKCLVSVYYIRAMIHELMWEDLTLEQAIFAIIALDCISDLQTSDHHKQKLRQEIEFVAPGMSKWCRHIILLRRKFEHAGWMLNAVEPWLPFDDTEWPTRDITGLDLAQESAAVHAAWNSQPEVIRTGRIFF